MAILPRLPRVRVLLALVTALIAGSASRVAAAPSPPSNGEVQALRFEKEILSAQLNLAKQGTPYFQLDPWTGELELVVGGVVVSRFPAKKCLVGRDLRRMLRRKDPTSPIVQPFKWAGLEHRVQGSTGSSASLRLEPSLRIDFEGSPSNFFWRWVRFQMQDRLGALGKKASAMNLVLFYHPDSLATLTPLLDDTLSVLISPFGSAEPGGR